MSRVLRTVARRVGTAMALTVAAVVGLGAPGAGATATDPTVPLVVGSTNTAHVRVPYPGHTAAFDLTARAVSGTSSEVVLRVDGGTGPLASGPDALQLVLSDSSGRVLAEGTASELASAPIALGTLGTEPIVLHGTATLPASAGDDLQGVGMTLRLSLVASQDEAPLPPEPGRLAITGTGILLLLLLFAVLLGSGLGLRAAHRRRARTAGVAGIVDDGTIR